MSESSTSILCIELDCLLDTRLATLYQIDPAAASDAMASGYEHRVEDRFKVDAALFHSLYAARDRLILKNSLMTPMVRLCREFVEQTLRQKTDGPFQYTPQILINAYPYVLADSETETITRAVATAVKEYCDIQTVFYDYAQLSPAWVKQTCSILVLYHYPDWLEYHSLNGNWKKTTCPEVTLMGPALYFNGLPSDQILAEAKQLQLTPFEAMEQLAGPLIQLSLLPIRYFSAEIPYSQMASASRMKAS